jgi:hypothetical protein
MQVAHFGSTLSIGWVVLRSLSGLNPGDVTTVREPVTSYDGLYNPNVILNRLYECILDVQKNPRSFLRTEEAEAQLGKLQSVQNSES